MKGSSLRFLVALSIGLAAIGTPARSEIRVDPTPVTGASARGPLPINFSLTYSTEKGLAAPIGVTAERDEPAELPAGVQGPTLAGQDTAPPHRWTDHVPRRESRYPGFLSQVGRIKWETLAGFAYFTAINSPKFFKKTTSLHFKDEGWFGKSTDNLGVDKLTHAYDSYILAEMLHARLHDKTGAARGDALTAALLAVGMMAYSELSDGIETDSGISMQDLTMNAAGATFSVLRNTIPGLREKLDFRLLLIPNSNIYTRTGKRHYEQQRYLMALQLSGFDRFRDTPLRLLELHAGYYASGFTNQDRARGETPRRHLFFGVGLNIRELFFHSPRSTVGRVTGIGLDYLQIPYTAKHWD